MLNDIFVDDESDDDDVDLLDLAEDVEEAAGGAGKRTLYLFVYFDELQKR